MSVVERSGLQEDPWMQLSAELMKFLRERQALDAVEEGVWLYRGNAQSQLAAFLRDQFEEPPPVTVPQ